MPRALAALALPLAVAALVGCTALEQTATPSPVPSSAPASPPPPSGDGVLRIGTLAPLTGAQASLGPVQVAAVEVAVRQIDAAGGVLGAPVEVVHRNAADASSQQAEAAFADLVERGVDVVIGPSEPALLERLVPLAAEAGVALLVPGAGTAAVGALDETGVLVRVSPPATAQAAAVARSLVADGVDSLAVLTGADDEGAAIVAAVEAALEGTEVDVVVPEPLAAATDVDELATALLEPEPGDGEEAAPDPVDAVLLAPGPDALVVAREAAVALVDAGLDAEGVWALAPDVSSLTAILAAAELEGASGVRPGVPVDDAFRALLRQSDPGIATTIFAAEVADAVALVAVAAELAGDDGAASLLHFLPAAAADGVPCTSFGACLDVIQQDRDPDLDGRSGLLTLNADGDVVDARLQHLIVTSTGELAPEGSLGD